MYAATAAAVTACAAHAASKNVWRELSGRAHFNINELSGNNAKVPLPPHGGRNGVGLKEAGSSPRLAGDSLVINHV